MAAVPKKVADRIVNGIKQYQPVLNSAKSRDVNEADTVTIVKDMLADIFGYDKYSELTSEHAVRGTYCDLATKVDGQIQTLIEVKAIGLDLKDNHVRQAIDYAVKERSGVEWVLLTNGMNWRVYHVVFAKPIDYELVIDIDFNSLNHKNVKDMETLYLWCKEGFARSVLGEYHVQKQALSRFMIGNIVQTQPVLDAIRKELKRISPDVRIENEQILSVLSNEVIKRDVLEGEKADEAQKLVIKAAKKFAATKKPSSSPSTPQQPSAIPSVDGSSGHVSESIESSVTDENPAA